MNPLTEMFFAPEEAEKLRVVGEISTSRLRELASAEREGRVRIVKDKERYAKRANTECEAEENP